MFVVMCVSRTIVPRVIKTFETSKTNSLILAEKGHYVEGETFVSVIVNDELNWLTIDYQVNAIHEVSFKKRRKGLAI